jgi:sec-independent protein translocase protein TatA
MAGLGGPELIIVLIIFVLLFGAKKLPELGSSIGKGIKNFKRGIDEAGEGDEDERHVTNEGNPTRSDQT